MKAPSKTSLNMAMVSTPMPTETPSLAIGQTIFRMDMGSTSSPQGLATKASFSTVSSKAKAPFIIKHKKTMTFYSIMGNGKLPSLTEKELPSIRMETNSKETLNEAHVQGLVSITSIDISGMKENGKITAFMAMVNFLGTPLCCLMDVSSMGSNMDPGSTSIKMVTCSKGYSLKMSVGAMEFIILLRDAL